eukprot:gene7036-8180_t
MASDQAKNLAAIHELQAAAGLNDAEIADTNKIMQQLAGFMPPQNQKSVNPFAQARRPNIMPIETRSLDKPAASNPNPVGVYASGFFEAIRKDDSKYCNEAISVADTIRNLPQIIPNTHNVRALREFLDTLPLVLLDGLESSSFAGLLKMMNQIQPPSGVKKVSEYADVPKTIPSVLPDDFPSESLFIISREVETLRKYFESNPELDQLLRYMEQHREIQSNKMVAHLKAMGAVEGGAGRSPPSLIPAFAESLDSPAYADGSLQFAGARL